MASGRIFLSYRRDDTQGVAGRLFDRLAKRFGAANVFIDVVAIEPGRDFSEAIERAVGGCGVLLALIGKKWLSGTDEHGRCRIDDPTDLVRLEIKSALDRKIQVIPVLVDGAMAPRLDDLPEVLAPLARLNAVRLDHETFDADVGPLMKVLDRAVRQPPPWRPWLITAAALGVIIVVTGYDRVTPNEIRDEGSEQIAARKVYVVSRIQPSDRPACQVNIPGIAFTSRTDAPRVEVVQLLVHGADSRTVEQMCSYARALAEVVVPRLPR